MVDINGKSYSDIIKIKGTDKKIDLTKLAGLQRTEQNKAIFDMADHNKDGVIDTKEAKSLQGSLLTSSNGNGKLSEREANRLYGKGSNAFDAINALADQQKAFEEGKEYIETDGNKSTHYSKGFTYTEIENGELVTKVSKGISYTQEVHSDGSITTTTDDGVQEIQYKDGTSQQIHTDGTVISYDKNGKTTSVLKEGNTTTFPDDNTSITKNPDGKTIQTTVAKDGEIIRTDFEYQDNKTIERVYSDIGESAPLTSITVRETKDGHNIDTKYATEEDMTNNRPSEVVTDAHNPTQKTVTKYTYNEDGTYSTETTDSAGTKTVKNFNADGTEITGQKPEVQTTHTVVKGESITKIVTDALKQQGIENPTPEQIKEAKQEFLELNKDLVKTYNGVRKEWHGNKFFYPDDVVKIPNFAGEEAKPAVENEEDKTYYGGELEEVVITAKKPSEETIQRKKDIQEKLGKDFEVGYDNDGNIEVRDLKGNILPEATRRANEGISSAPVENTKERPLSEEEKQALEEYDTDKTESFNKTEYTKMMMDTIESLGIVVDDSNRDEIQKIIDEAFANIDADNLDGNLTKAELTQKGTEATSILADKLNELLEKQMGE